MILIDPQMFNRDKSQLHLFLLKEFIENKWMTADNTQTLDNNIKKRICDILIERMMDGKNLKMLVDIDRMDSNYFVHNCNEKLISKVCTICVHYSNQTNLPILL